VKKHHQCSQLPRPLFSVFYQHSHIHKPPRLYHIFLCMAGKFLGVIGSLIGILMSSKVGKEGPNQAFLAAGDIRPTVAPLLFFGWWAALHGACIGWWS